jgi:hypothetical protein
MKVPEKGGKANTSQAIPDPHAGFPAELRGVIPD